MKQKVYSVESTRGSASNVVAPGSISAFDTAHAASNFSIWVCSRIVPILRFSTSSIWMFDTTDTAVMWSISSRL